MVKINSLQLENVKRIRAVQLTPAPTGLTVIGGRNGQGKTSVLDAIAWALGGARFAPGAPQRDGSVTPPSLRVELSNGLVVQRRGKTSALTVTDPSGRRAGQQLLDSFISELALNLPKFLAASDREKVDTLLQTIGVGERLAALDREIKAMYDRRTAIGQIAAQKRHYADEMASYPDAPDEPVSAAELIRRQQDILARNGENQRKRDQLTEITHAKHRCQDELGRLKERIAMLQEQYDRLLEQYNDTAAQEAVALKTVAELRDESTAEMEASLANIEQINRKVRANLDKARAEDEAHRLAVQYDTLSSEIAAKRKERLALLSGADLPLPGLSVDEENRLTLDGKPWDCMSGSQQLMAATAIVRRLNPECGFVLLDKLEQMDSDTLAAFGAWLEGQGLQAIATRVSTGSECSVIIEDGYIQPTPTRGPERKWKEGEF